LENYHFLLKGCSSLVRIALVTGLAGQVVHIVAGEEPVADNCYYFFAAHAAPAADNYFLVRWLAPVAGSFLVVDTGGNYSVGKFSGLRIAVSVTRVPVGNF
jgi:hypothetical protein